MNFEKASFNPGSGAAPGTQGYVYHDPRIVLAVNVALATRRPLLVTGVPGAGKSTLATDVARRLDWAYVATTVTSRTRLEDLVARFDAVQRLNDAQSKLQVLKEAEAYLIPGVFWWAFDPLTAGQMAGAQDPRSNSAKSVNGTVVLLDEIDKAEPDLPNDLLALLDTYSITVPGRGPIVAAHDVLVLVTSNGERTMPPAFLRRCVVLELDDDDPGLFTSVATAHFGARGDSLYADIARRTTELGTKAEEGRRRKPSMAEYLDTVRACLTFGERPANATTDATPLWAAIEEAALRKTRDPRQGPAPGG
jgi:MoxR-like ATPase